MKLFWTTGPIVGAFLFLMDVPVAAATEIDPALRNENYSPQQRKPVTVTAPTANPRPETQLPEASRVELPKSHQDGQRAAIEVGETSAKRLVPRAGVRQFSTRQPVIIRPGDKMAALKSSGRQIAPDKKVSTIQDAMSAASAHNEHPVFVEQNQKKAGELNRFVRQDDAGEGGLVTPAGGGHPGTR